MKKFLLWVVAILITLIAVVYQRMTGPTYPKRVKTEINNKEYKLKLLRSHGGTTDAPIELAIDADIQASLYYKFYPLHEGEEWHQVPFSRDGENLVAKLPNQPAAGKLMYYITITNGDKNIELQKENPVVIRF
jgi:hypothetical protein